MKRLAFFLCCCFSWQTSACEWQHTDKVKGFVSLSTPISAILQELDLLTTAALKGVSTFHPIPLKVQVNRFGGGVFLGQKQLQKFATHVIFFDQSVELAQKLKRQKDVHAIEVTTRELSPFEVHADALKKLTPWLKNCQFKLNALQEKVKKIEMDLLAAHPFVQQGYFFLGEIGPEDRLPPLMIVNDGAIKWWVEHKKLVTLESKLNYVAWSQRWLQSLGKADWIVGISESNNEAVEDKWTELRTNRWNVIGRGSLAPGLWQLEWMGRFVTAAQEKQLISKP